MNTKRIRYTEAIVIVVIVVIYCRVVFNIFLCVVYKQSANSIVTTIASFAGVNNRKSQKVEQPLRCF